jgi:RNA polymerase sigma-70 factor (ECF subfamily)
MTSGGALQVDDEEREDFERWYLASRSALIGVAFLYVGSIEDACDLTQETFARAWKDWDKVRRHPNRDAWSRLVLHNLVVTRWRRTKLERTRTLPIGEVGPYPSADHLDLARLVATLPAKQRRAFILHEVLDLSVDDVALEMRAPAGTVRSWLHRARKHLASQIAPETRPSTSKDRSGQ